VGGGCATSSGPVTEGPGGGWGEYWGGERKTEKEKGKTEENLKGVSGSQGGGKPPQIRSLERRGKESKRGREGRKRDRKCQIRKYGKKKA